MRHLCGLLIAPMWATWMAVELQALGRQEAYEEVIDRAVAWFAARPASEVRLAVRFDRARTFDYAERWSDADTLFVALDSLFTPLLESVPDIPWRQLAILIDLRGHRAGAVRVLHPAGVRGGDAARLLPLSRSGLEAAVRVSAV